MTILSFSFRERVQSDPAQPARSMALTIFFVALAVACLAIPAPLRAQQAEPQPDHGSRKLSLSERQAIIRDRVARLEDRMFQLSQAIRKSEPEKAAQLLESLGAARGMMIRQQMEEIIRKLERQQYADATDSQKQVSEDLQALLRMLLEGPEKLEDRKKEIERLEAIKQELDRVIQEQREARKNARAAAGKADDRLDAAIDQLEKLVERQNALSAQSARPDVDAQKSAEQQEQLRSETDALADELRDSAAGQAGKPNGDSEMTQAAEGLERAAGAMEDAEQQLRQGNPDLAKPAQDSAGKQLRDTLEQLKKKREQDKAARRAESPIEKQSAEQKQITQKTKQLGKQMDPSGGSTPKPGNQDSGSQDGQESGQKKESSGGQPSGNQQGGQKGDQDQSQSDQPDAHEEESSEAPTPGSREVQEAVPFQEEAEKNLDQQNPDKAEQAQGKAIEKLEQARKELEETLEQLRKEQQEELLAALESRFKAMLARQIEVNKGTERLDGLGVENWRRADQLELADLSQKQAWVGEEADQALYILKEEGTTVVFPQVVEHLRDDAAEASRLLVAATTGEPTRSIQAGIVNTLRELIEAIEKKQAENEGDGGGGQSGGSENQNQPLLPASAELKLLRSCQVRVNEATVRLEDEISEAVRETDELRDRREKLARRQEQVHEMARSMHEALRRAQ